MSIKYNVKCLKYLFFMDLFIINFFSFFFFFLLYSNWRRWIRREKNATIIYVNENVHKERAKQFISIGSTHVFNLNDELFHKKGFLLRFFVVQSNLLRYMVSNKSQFLKCCTANRYKMKRKRWIIAPNKKTKTKYKKEHSRCNCGISGITSVFINCFFFSFGFVVQREHVVFSFIFFYFFGFIDHVDGVC